MKIIGIGHRRYTGKDTAAKYICTEYRLKYRGANVKKVNFADKLKDIAFDLYAWAGVKNKEFYELYLDKKDDFIPEINKTVRQIWIDLGTPAIRENVYQETWIRYVLENINNDKLDLLVIADVRFHNEVEAIRNKGGIILKTERPSMPISNDIADSALADYNGWNYVITANTLNELYNQVQVFIEKFL